MADLRTSPSVSSIQRSASMLNTTSQAHDARTDQPVFGVTSPDKPDDMSTIKTKSHLPQVVLRHKMREFEAKMNASSVLADPLESSGGLNRLSIEDKERVMIRMQEKIRSITDEIEADFVRIRRELDAHGVFDEAANYQRAQTMCLVELQRRCKLEKIRDESIDEIMGVKKTSDLRRLSSAFLYSATSSANTTKMEKKVTTRLHNPERDPLPTNKNQSHRHATSQGKKRAGALPKLAPESRPNTTATTGSCMLKSEVSLSSGNSKIVPASRQGQKLDREHFNEVGGSQETQDELWGRHQHVMFAIQTLNSGKGLTKAIASSGEGSARGNGDLEMESDHRLSLAEEWQERSASYRVIAQRTLDELWARTERCRWDSTGYFHSPTISLDDTEGLINGLEAQQMALLRPFGQTGLVSEESEHEEREMNEVINESLSMKRQRASEQYAQLQTQIIERLNRWSAPTSSPAIKRHLSRQVTSPAPEDTMISRSAVENDQSTGLSVSQESKPPAPKNLARAAVILVTQTAKESEEAERKGSSSDCRESTRVPELGASASMPAIGSVGNLSSPSTLTPALERPGTRHRLSLLERRILARQNLENEGEVAGGWMAGHRGSVRASRRGFRRESRIGAPTPVADFATFGRHSDARMAERRYSAQTWTWFANENAEGDQDEADSSEDDGDFDDMTLEEGDEDDDDEEVEERMNNAGGDHFTGTQLKPRSGLDFIGDDEDETRSDASGPLIPQSARSSTSVATTTLSASSKRTARNTGDRRRRASKRRPPRTNEGTARNAALSGDALNLHMRLETIWRALEFPFSHKLLMVEKYAEAVDDPSAFEKALTTWESCVCAVIVRERMKNTLAEFSEKHELKSDIRLTAEDIAALNAAIKEGNCSARDVDEFKSVRMVEPNIVLALTADSYIKWVSDCLELTV